MELASISANSISKWELLHLNLPTFCYAKLSIRLESEHVIVDKFANFSRCKKLLGNTNYHQLLNGYA